MIRSGKQTGYILLPVIVVITLVAAIALLMNTESALESNTAASELDAQQAQYVAEAGLNHALWLSRQQGCGPYSDLTDEPLGSDNYSSQLITDLGGTTAFTINVDQDSWIRSDLPTQNKGVDLKLHTRNETLGTERPLLRYDLSPLAAKAQILSATAWFYITDAHAAGPIDIHLTSADWTETDATWDSMNANMDSAVLATIPSQPAIGLWLPVNLTAQVQAWVNGQSNFGITLNSAVDGVHGQYNSRESANPPYLEVVVGAPPSSPAVLKADATLDNGITRSLLRNDVALTQYPRQFVELRPDAASGFDTYLDQSNPGFNNGISDDLWLENASGSNNDHILLKFSLGRLPVGVRIENATLQLRQNYLSTAGGEVEIHRLRRDWEEGNDVFTNGPGATWNNATTAQGWSVTGGEFDAEVIASATIAPLTSGDYNWDITQLVQSWASNAIANDGMLIKAETPGTLFYFSSSDHTIEVERPRLTITYSCACGTVCVPPQGSGNLLMVVINPTTLVPSDDAKKSLFESWGYTVSVISESSNQATYDAAVAVNDVVFISETVNSNSVGAKLADSPIGVVSQDGDYNNDLGFSTTFDHTVAAAIDVTDTDHYITRPFAIGPLEIYANDMEQLTVNGSKAAGLQTLAESSGKGALVVLDTGAALDGGTAAGRRVMLPLGREGNFVWDQLNNNGRLIVQRALTWGAGLETFKLNPQLLLVVANPSSLTTQESARKTLIESWGITVNLIDESASQANFDAAITANDVAYIPEDINSGNLGSKLADASIGVVNEEGELVDELGFSNNKIFKSRMEIDIIDNSHYISQSFATGLLAFVSGNQSVHMLSNSVAPGLQTLGESFNTGSLWAPSLGTLDAGDGLSGGGTASGRRVQLPWGGGSFDINLLTDDGRTIMRRAIEWAGGMNLVMNPYAHWKLDETSGPTAVDSEGGNDGTLIGGQTWTPGLFQGGIDFDGSNDYVDAGTFDVSGSGITMMGWFNAEAITTDDGRIVSKANGPNEADAWWQLSTTDSGSNRYLRMRIKAGGATTTLADSSVNLITDRWYFAVGTYDNVSGEMKLYLDGVEVASGAHALGGALDADPLVPVAIGANGTAERFFNGILDDVRVYGHALSSGEIEELAKLPGPIAHWKLDETSGFNAEDSASDNDGTLPGGNDWIPALIDGGLDFDGSNDYVDVGSFDVTGSGITMMGWFNAEAITTDDGRIVSKANGSNEANAWWQLSTTDSGSNRYLRMRIKAGGTTTTMADSSVNLSTGKWYLAVATYSNATGDMKLYLDGTEVASGTHEVGGAVATDAAVPIAIGANGTAERFFNGILDDVRVYDYALPASVIADLYAANPPPGPTSYTELYQPWSATSDDTWQTFDLGAFGVPANAVVEVAVVNSDFGKEFFGGVRAVGSSLQRRFALHEAEGGGVDTVTMHVQADASSRIQHYSDKSNRVSFILLGYWAGATYVERFDAFKAGANASWQTHDLGAYGVAPNQVAEIAMSQTSTSVEWLVGARRPGSGLARLLPLHEAEGGGIDMVTLMAGTDASSIVEVYAEANSVVDFHLLGYWSTPSGTYTESGGVHGQATVAGSWLTTDLSSFGVPANSIAQFVMSNEGDANENQMGLRAVGSTINNRRLDLQEAESGGGDLGTMHVGVDAVSQIQWAAEYGATDGYFYPVGWWVLSP